MSASKDLFLPCLSWFLLLAQTFAQSSCEGNTSTYEQNGLVVPFENFCGLGLEAGINFPDSTKESSWADCQSRCVEKEPLCFGFYYNRNNTNCYQWYRAPYPDTSTIPKTVGDSAMLTPDFVAGLSSDCRKLGLWGCFEKNGQFEADGSLVSSDSSSASVSTPSTLSSSSRVVSTAFSVSSNTPSPTVTTTNIASSDAQSDDEGLSTGAKAGIGSGIGVLVLALCVVGAYFFLKGRRQRLQGVAAGSTEREKVAPVELAGQQDPYTTTELPATHEPDDSIQHQRQYGVDDRKLMKDPLHEIG